jgi:hypothetical protein
VSDILRGPAERRAVLEYDRRAGELEVRFRAHILLLLNAGFPWATISAALFCSSSTIGRWERRYQPDGVDAVLGRPKWRRRSVARLWAGVVVR